MASRIFGRTGVRTDAFDGMVALYRQGLGLRMLDMRQGDARFALADGTRFHIYANDDRAHAFFGAGPVVAFEVDDVDASRLQLEAAGAVFLGDPREDDDARWNHFRAPDGNIYEIIQRFG